MCCCSNQKPVRYIGLVIVILLFLAAAFAIVYSGFNYNLANANLSTFSWKNVSIITLSGMGYIIFTSFIGIFTFWCANICVIIIFCILLMISILVSLFLSLFGVIQASSSKLDSILGCNTTNTDFLNLFKSVDNYLYEVDKSMCTYECPCYFTESNNYEMNSTIALDYRKWIKADKNNGAINYGFCSDSVKNKVYQAYVSNPFNNTKYFNLNQTEFIEFFKVIEDSYRCTGFCNNTYIDNTNTQKNMYKYLFSDLSRNYPDKFGCLPSILEYFLNLLKTIGYALIAASFFQIIAFILACSLCYIPKNVSDDKYINQDNFGIKRQ